MSFSYQKDGTFGTDAGAVWRKAVPNRKLLALGAGMDVQAGTISVSGRGPKRTTEMMIEALVAWRQQPEASTQECFWKLMERFRADLLNQAFAILGSMQDAEDVVQESLCQAFERIDTLESPASLGRWLRKINKYNAFHFYRRKKREHSRQEEQLETDIPAPETTASGQNAEVASRVGKAEFVARAMESLPELHRSVVVLRYWEHLSYEEIAERLELPLGTVKSRIARADQMMAKKLKRLWFAENR